VSAFDTPLHGIRRVILMESKLQDLSDGLKDIGRRIVDHEGRLIRIETLIEVAQRWSGGTAEPPKLP
jgi:hypothetical protein